MRLLISCLFVIIKCIVDSSSALDPTTSSPTLAPSLSPSISPTTTISPSTSPTITTSPSTSPTITTSPSTSPNTNAPTTVPTNSPKTSTPSTAIPTTNSPTFLPTTRSPTRRPTKRPTTSTPTTRNPTFPTKMPTFSPTTKPNSNPTRKPSTSRPTTSSPTLNPTTISPTLNPTTLSPTNSPTLPTNSPTLSPTEPTTPGPTQSPTEPTNSPTTESPTTPKPTIKICPRGSYLDSSNIPCNELGVIPSLKTPNICASTWNMDRRQCFRRNLPATYEEAERACNIVGMRLCTVKELDNGVGDNKDSSKCNIYGDETTKPNNGQGPIVQTREPTIPMPGDAIEDKNITKSPTITIEYNRLRHRYLKSKKKKKKKPTIESGYLYWTSTPCDLNNSNFRFARSAFSLSSTKMCLEKSLFMRNRIEGLQTMCCSRTIIPETVAERVCTPCPPGYTTISSESVGESSCISVKDLSNVQTKTPSTNVKRPNILLIISDDLQAPVLSGFKEQNISKTPNIDRLMERGVSFSNAACQVSFCGPSRVSVLTGARPDNIGVTDLITGMRERHGSRVTTIPQFLLNNGYRDVYAIGKLFDGRNTGGPEVQDFPASWSEFPTNPYTDLDYPPRSANDSCGLPEDSSQSERQISKCYSVQGNTLKDDAFLVADGKLLSETERRLDPRKQYLRYPWFLAVGLGAPHLPWVAPKEFFDMYNRTSFDEWIDKDMRDFIGPPGRNKDIGYKKNSELSNYQGFPSSEPASLDPPKPIRQRVYHAYFAATSFMDYQVGRIMRALESRGEEEVNRTMIIFFGDNGFSLGKNSMFGKHTIYDLSARVPLVIVPPILGAANEDRFLNSRGKISGTPVELLDVFPTIIDFLPSNSAQPTPGLLDGRSLKPLLEDPNKQEHKRIIINQFPAGSGIMSYSFRTFRYRFVVHIKGNSAGDGRVEDQELYDYLLDPRETINVISNKTFYGSVISEFTHIFSTFRSNRWVGIDGKAFDADQGYIPANYT